MRFFFDPASATALTLLSLAATASARIVGINVPAQLVPGQTFDATILTENYIQSIKDVAIAFGIVPTMYAVDGTLGTAVLGQMTLGDEYSNTINNISATINVPSDLALGESVFVASLYSLLGSRYSPSVGLFNVTVEVVETSNSTDTVSSVGSRYIY